MVELRVGTRQFSIHALPGQFIDFVFRLRNRNNVVLFAGCVFIGSAEMAWKKCIVGAGDGDNVVAVACCHDPPVLDNSRDRIVRLVVGNYFANLFGRRFFHFSVATVLSDTARRNF